MSLSSTARAAPNCMRYGWITNVDCLPHARTPSSSAAQFSQSARVCTSPLPLPTPGKNMKNCVSIA